MEPAAFSHGVKLIFVLFGLIQMHSAAVCPLGGICWSKWTGDLSDRGSSDRRVNWMMNALLWLMGHFYSQFWVWVRSAVSPHLSCVHQSITSLPHFPVFSPCFSPSFQPKTFSYSTLSYLCLHFDTFLWNLAVFSQMVLSALLLYHSFPAISAPFPSV